MSLHASIHKFLTSKSEVTSIVGGNIWRKHRQTEALPAIVFHSPTSSTVKELRKATEISLITIQFDIYSVSDEQGILLAGILEDLLNGFSGNLEGTEVPNIKFYGDHDLSIPPADNSGKWTYQRSCDFVFKVRRK